MCEKARKAVLEAMDEGWRQEEEERSRLEEPPSQNNEKPPRHLKQTKRHKNQYRPRERTRLDGTPLSEGNAQSGEMHQEERNQSNGHHPVVEQYSQDEYPRLNPRAKGFQPYEKTRKRAFSLPLVPVFYEEREWLGGTGIHQFVKAIEDDEEPPSEALVSSEGDSVEAAVDVMERDMEQGEYEEGDRRVNNEGSAVSDAENMNGDGGGSYNENQKERRSPNGPSLALQQQDNRSHHLHDQSPQVHRQSVVHPVPIRPLNIEHFDHYHLVEEDSGEHHPFRHHDVPGLSVPPSGPVPPLPVLWFPHDHGPHITTEPFPDFYDEDQSPPSRSTPIPAPRQPRPSSQPPSSPSASASANLATYAQATTALEAIGFKLHEKTVIPELQWRRTRSWCGVEGCVRHVEVRDWAEMEERAGVFWG